MKSRQSVILTVTGTLIIISALGSSGWWLAIGHQWSDGFTAVLVAACLSGIMLIFNERAAELSFGRFGAIKVAARQIVSDAEEIAAIRSRVEAQAATMDLVAKESFEAKRLLHELTAQNELAESKLKELGARTSTTMVLPDGRTKIGNAIVGSPSLLQPLVDDAMAAFRADDLHKACELFTQCIDAYEAGQDAEHGIGLSTGGVNPSAMAEVYALAAETARRMGNLEIALLWARKSVKTEASPKRNALLVGCLLQAEKLQEANAFIATTLESDTVDSQEFRNLLIEWGILKAPPGS